MLRMRFCALLRARLIHHLECKCANIKVTSRIDSARASEAPLVAALYR